VVKTKKAAFKILPDLIQEVTKIDVHDIEGIPSVSTFYRNLSKGPYPFLIWIDGTFSERVQVTEVSYLNK
jgi:hypothetical protein